MIRFSQHLSKSASRNLGTAVAAATPKIPNVPPPGTKTNVFEVQDASTATDGAVAGMQPWQLAMQHKEKPMFFGNPELQDLLVKPDYRPIVPKYWMNGTNAVHESMWQIDGSKFDFSKIIVPKQDGSDGYELDRNTSEFESLHEVCSGLWEELGLYHLTKTGLTDPKKMAVLPDILFPVSTNYHGGSNYRGKVADNVFDTGAPLTANLQMHHEMAYVATSVKNLQFMCMQAPHLGTCGGTFAAHNETAHAYFMETIGEKAKEKGICYVRKLPDLEFYKKNGGDPRAVYNYWQTSFHTNDPEEAAEEARKAGLKVEWQDSKLYGRYMVTKYYTSAFEYDPFHDKNRLYGSIADSHEWFDSWPGVMELDPNERPLALTWGDDEPTTYQERWQWCHAYDLGGCKIDWKVGDAALICNYRWAHGRPAINLKPGERREIGVRLGETLHRQGVKAGKGFD
jgi:hypothetical protein